MRPSETPVFWGLDLDKLLMWFLQRWSRAWPWLPQGIIATVDAGVAIVTTGGRGRGLGDRRALLRWWPSA